MINFDRLREDKAHFERERVQSPARDPLAVRRALKRAYEKHEPELPELPRIECAEDIERLVPGLPYLLALIREAGVYEML